MDELYDVVFSGHTQPGLTLEEIAGNLVSISNIAVEKAKALVSSGKPAIMKRAVSKETAETMAAKLSKAGLEMRLVKTAQPAASSISAPPHTPPETPPRIPDEQKPNFAAQEAPSLPVNPYAAPKANLKDEQRAADVFLHEPQKVKAGRGWKWITEAISLFLAEPWKWLGMYFTAFLLAFLIQIIPFIGWILNILLGTVFAGGLMSAAHRLHTNKTLQFGDLFNGFSSNRNQLLLIGVYYILMLLGIIVVMAGIVFVTLGTALFNPQTASAAIQQNWFMFLIVILLSMAIMIPVIMAIWFAPCLVSITDSSAATAMKLSLRACYINVLPFLVYGLGTLLFCFALGIVFAVISGLMASLAGHSGSIFLFFIPFLSMLVLGLPLMVVIGLSAYTGFKDLFFNAAR